MTETEKDESNGGSRAAVAMKARKSPVKVGDRLLVSVGFDCLTKGECKTIKLEGLKEVSVTREQSETEKDESNERQPYRCDHEARKSTVKVGDKLLVGGGFDCLTKGECKTVKLEGLEGVTSFENLYIECKIGRHFLAGHIKVNAGDELIGLFFFDGPRDVDDVVG